MKIIIAYILIFPKMFHFFPKETRKKTPTFFMALKCAEMLHLYLQLIVTGRW